MKKNSRITEYIVTEIPEFTDENVKEVMETYLSAPVFEECDKRLREYITSIIPDAKIDYKNKEWDTTPEYAKHRYHDNVIWLFQDICKSMELEEEWVKIHGKLHTDEEAAKIAAEKVMEICFGWHLQDNGALNEEHSFMASMLATSLGNDVKKDISDEVKQKAYDLCYGYFLGYLKYVETLNKYDYSHMDDYRNWLKENIPSDNTERFNWEHIYGGLDCDYDPNYPWYLIFLNAGVKESAIRLICPWKTGISIRYIDNAVQYRTYGNIENL